MADEAQAVATQPVQSQEAVAKPAPSIIERVASMKEEAPADPLRQELPRVDLNEIKDPIAKQVIEKKIKDLESGFNKKYEQLAELRKQAEATKVQLEQEALKPYDEARVQELLRRQDFIAAAQKVYQSQQATQPPPQWEGNAEQWSALSDSDKQRFMQLEGRLNGLLQNQALLMHQQEHEKIKSRYQDYDPKAVDTFVEQTRNLTGDQIKELAYKAMNYDRHMERAYKLAMQDKAAQMQEKMNGSTIPSARSAEVVGERPVQNKGESSQNFFKRLANWNMAQSSKGK